ncbi:MAG: FAD-dependent oxidoreductase [Paracoccaceae bacterium]
MVKVSADDAPTNVTNSQKSAVIVGAGIIGLTSAYVLANAGCVVTIVDRENDPCEQSSHANGGQLLYDRIGAMASPGFLRNLPGLMAGRDPGIRVSGLARPANWRWVWAFLGRCTTGAWQRNTEQLLAIARRSRRTMQSITEKHDLEFDLRKPGKLLIHSTAGSLAAASTSLEFHKQFGGRHQILNAAECIAREPALSDSSRPIVGGVYLPDAEVADCRKFGIALADLLVAEYGVQIVYGQDILAVTHHQNRVHEIRSQQRAFNADIFVLATGHVAAALLPQGFPGRKPVTAIKGMTLTFPAHDAAPDLSVSDVAGKFVMLRLGNRVRVAGYAIFTDGPISSPKLVRDLTDKARSLMPGAADYAQQPEVWTGSRPTTPDDLPMIGRSGTDNLFVNAGHGSLGWTLALGAAEILLESVENATT